MLRYSKEKLESESAVTDIYFKAQLELEIRKQLYEQYRRKLTDEELASLTDEDIKVPLERYIAIMSAGYFGGKVPIFKVKAYNKKRNKIIEDLFGKSTNDKKAVEEIEAIIKHICEYNDVASLFLREVLDYLVKRACYEVYYKDKKTNEIVIAKMDALETIAIWDYSAEKQLIGLYRIIQTTMANGEYQNMIELTTVNGKKYYYDTPEKRKIFGKPEYDDKYKDEPLFKENEDERKPRLWDDDIPATAIENEDGLAIFEPVISLIKAYQQVIQNSRNTFKYNDEAILAVIGYQAENQMTIQDENGNEIINPARVIEDEYVLNSKVRYLDGSNDTRADLKWVIKDVNDSALQNHKKTLMDIICLCSFCPNMTDLGFTNADNNSAIEKKFFGLQQYIATFEGDFKKGLLRRWEIILNKFNKDKGKQYDFRDIEVFLQRNIPTDKATETDRWLKYRGLLPDETIIDNLPDDLDAESEIDKMNEQNAKNMQQNLENIKQIGNNSNKQYEVKDKEAVDVGISGQENARAKEDVQQAEQTDTTETSRDI